MKSYLNRFHRSTFAKFRCGVLPLQIEVGRFRGQDEAQRICPICKRGVESELHFLFDCTVYDRGTYFHDIGLDVNLDNVSKIKTCMVKDQKSLAKFICNIWLQRQSLINV